MGIFRLNKNDINAFLDPEKEDLKSKIKQLEYILQRKCKELTFIHKLGIEGKIGLLKEFKPNSEISQEFLNRK